MFEGKELAGCWRKLRCWGLHDSFWSTNAVGDQAKEGGRAFRIFVERRVGHQAFLSKT